MGIPKHLIQLLKGLYEDQSAVIRTEFGDTDRFKIKKGVRQGCILSPFLFNLYAERIMIKAEMEEAKEGVKIAGRTLNNLRYADDTTLMTGKKADLAKLIRRLKTESEKAGLYFNIKETKIMTTANWNSFEIDGEEIEVVSSFTFLGSEVEKEGRCDKEIKRRVVIGKATMIGLEKLWRDKHVSTDTKKDSENTNFPDSSVWLRDVDNDKENGKKDQRMRDVDMEEDAKNIMDGEED